MARIVEESAEAFSTPLNSPYTTGLNRRAHSLFGSEQLICAALEELLIRLTTGMTPSEYARSVKMLAELPGASADDCANNG